MSSEEINNLREEVAIWKSVAIQAKEETKEYKMEVKSLRLELHDVGESYKVGFDQVSQELMAVMEGNAKILNYLYNDEKTGRKGLIQSFSNMEDVVGKLTIMVEKLIGEKESKRRKRIKIWSAVSGSILVVWAVFKEFWHELFTWLKSH